MRRPAILVVFFILGACDREEISHLESLPPSAVDALKADLRTVMMAQERYYSTTGGYAATLDLLRAKTDLALTAGGAVEVVGAPNRFTISISKSVGAGAEVACRVTVGGGKATDGLIECR